MLPTDEVLRGVESLGLFATPRRVLDEDGSGTKGLEGMIDVEGHEVTLRVVLDRSFPLSLPRFVLQPWDALGFIPHVDRRGVVCFADPEGLVLDRRRPVEIVADAFHRAIGVLRDGVTGRNRCDFADEFEVYWRQLPGHVTAISVLDPSDRVSRAVVAFAGDRLFGIARDEQELSAFLSGQPVNGTLRTQEALYVPLEEATIIIPPRPDSSFWNAADVRRVLLPAVSPANLRRLRKLTKGRPAGQVYVVFKLPRPSGGETLFGIRYDGTDATHPLLEGSSARALTPVAVQRWDHSYLIQRGGGHAALACKRVLLVGCGALGGHLAFELVRAGILNLTLVDHDHLMPENSFRHVLGRTYWGMPKAQAVKSALEAQLPYSHVTAVVDTIHGALTSRSIDLSEYDLIILALGSPTVELDINERLYALHRNALCMVTWLEPLGIGGHALLSGNQRGGCFECLYTLPQDDNGPLYNRAAFAAPGQSFGRALSGCGSLHTPYGSVDALRTAALAARLAIDALLGKETCNPLLSWKGDATAFVAEGYRLSNRYNWTETELFRQRYSYPSPRCRICGAISGRVGLSA